MVRFDACIVSRSYLKRETKSQRIDTAAMIFPAFFGSFVSAAVLISDLSQVAPSGDKYPANLPIATPKVKSLYAGKRFSPKERLLLNLLAR